MSITNNYPLLRREVNLKRVDNYALVYDRNPSLHDIIHPSHALILSLCNGIYSLEHIAYLVGETYRLPQKEADDLVDKVLQKFDLFLRFLNEPDKNGSIRYDPQEFICNVSDKIPLNKHSQPIPVPIGINVTLTLACNFQCRYCYQKVASSSQGKLNLSKCLELAQEAAEWGVAYMGMTGGEPTLFKGWITLLERILSLGLSPILTTNGTVIGTDRSIAQHLKSIGLEYLTVSLDASKPELHHYITNSQNSFDRVVNAIKYLIEADIRVSVKHVLTVFNIGCIEDFLDFMVDLGVSEVGVSYMEAGAPGSNANLIPNLTSPQLKEARRIIQAKRDVYREICEIQPPRDGACQWGETDWYPCGGMFIGMSVFPSGKVGICDKLGEVDLFTYGNVFQHTLKELWESSSLQGLRDMTIDKSCIDKECKGCSKLNMCRTGCFVDSMKASGDYFKKHPNCSGPFDS